MSSLVDMIMQQMAGGGIGQLSRAIGADERTTSSAVAGALPLLIGGLARNSARADGAEALAGALERDHDGSILENVAGFLGQADSASGEGILRHVFGGQRPAVEQSLARNTGLDAGSAGQLLAMLAPLVLGALGRAQRQQGLGVEALAGLLGGERETARQSLSGSLGGLASLLDADGDGDATDDITRIGGKLLGGLFGGKR
jgi:hypothetical protein